VVTGGSSGIGQGIAVRLAQEGADVAFNFHSNPEGAAETTRQIEAAGLRAFAIKANLDSRESACALIAECAAHFTTLDLLLNNAGLEKMSPFLEVCEADYDHVLAVNLNLRTSPNIRSRAFRTATGSRIPATVCASHSLRIV